MKKLVALAAVVIAAATGCTTSKNPAVDYTGRITYLVEAFTLDGTTESSVLTPIHVVAHVEKTGEKIPHIRDGRTGAWLVLPWTGTEDVATPDRYQFTYDVRQAALGDFILTVQAVTTVDKGVHVRCVITDTSEQEIGISNEVTSDGDPVVVRCTSK